MTDQQIENEVEKASRLGVIQGTVRRQRKFQDQGVAAAQKRDARKMLRAQRGLNSANQMRQQTEAKLSNPNMGYKSSTQDENAFMLAEMIKSISKPLISGKKKMTAPVSAQLAAIKANKPVEQKAGTSAGAKKGWEARQDMRVDHKRYGPGVITHLNSGPEGKHVSVLFDNPAQAMLGPLPVKQQHLTPMKTQNKSVADQATLLVSEVLKAGNSEGAKKGWESRKNGQPTRSYLTAGSNDAAMVRGRLSDMGYKMNDSAGGEGASLWQHPKGYLATVEDKPGSATRVIMTAPMKHHKYVVTEKDLGGRFAEERAGKMVGIHDPLRHMPTNSNKPNADDTIAYGDSGHSHHIEKVIVHGKGARYKLTSTPKGGTRQISYHGQRSDAEDQADTNETHFSGVKH